MLWYYNFVLFFEQFFQKLIKIIPAERKKHDLFFQTENQLEKIDFKIPLHLQQNASQKIGKTLVPSQSAQRSGGFYTKLQKYLSILKNNFYKPAVSFQKNSLGNTFSGIYLHKTTLLEPNKNMSSLFS